MISLVQSVTRHDYSFSASDRDSNLCAKAYNLAVLPAWPCRFGPLPATSETPLAGLFSARGIAWQNPELR